MELKTLMLLGKQREDTKDVAVLYVLLQMHK